jgi:hypothetical protein
LEEAERFYVQELTEGSAQSWENSYQKNSCSLDDDNGVVAVSLWRIEGMGPISQLYRAFCAFNFQPLLGTFPGEIPGVQRRWIMGEGLWVLFG